MREKKVEGRNGVEDEDEVVGRWCPTPPESREVTCIHVLLVTWYPCFRTISAQHSPLGSKLTRKWSQEVTRAQSAMDLVTHQSLISPIWSQPQSSSVSWSILICIQPLSIPSGYSRVFFFGDFSFFFQFFSRTLPQPWCHNDHNKELVINKMFTPTSDHQ